MLAISSARVRIGSLDGAGSPLQAAASVSGTMNAPAARTFIALSIHGGLGVGHEVLTIL